MRVLYKNAAKGHVKLLLSGAEVRTGDLADAEATAWHAAREIGVAKIRMDGKVFKSTTVEWLELASGAALAGLSKCADGKCDLITDGDVMVGLNVSDSELFKAIVAGDVAVELAPSGVVLSARDSSDSHPAIPRKAVSEKGSTARPSTASPRDGSLVLHALRNGDLPWEM